MKNVIDLSQFNTPEDWLKVKESVDAAVIRLGYRGAHTGTITYDPKFQEFASACKRHGIPLMIYFFPCSISSEEARQEAKFIISAAKKLDLCGQIWLDSELVYQDRSGRADNLSKERRTRYLNVIMKDLRAAGYDCGVYASTAWFRANLIDEELGDCRRWVADWNDKCSYTAHRIDMWQYTSKGTVPGIKGRVDLSECYLQLGPGEKKAEKAGVTRQDIVDQMISWEGWSEANGKFKKIIDIYNYYLPTAVKAGTLNYKVKYSDEWCATAASAAYIQAGAPELFPIECGCPRTIELAKKMGIWKEADGYIPQPADAVLYDWQDSGSGDNTGIPDHIGIVIDVDRAAGTFAVMEGNKDEKVARRTMVINGRYIRGFVAPDFSEETETRKPEKKQEKKQEKTMKGIYEVSGTAVPSKKVQKTGLLKYGQKVTARRFPRVDATPCSFSPVEGLTRIDVCDTIEDETGKKWCYCKVKGLYGFILRSSILDFLRIGGLPTETVAKQVINGDFSTQGTREQALRALGYNPQTIQDKVNEILEVKPQPESGTHPRIRVWPIWFFEGDESQFGDATAIIQYGKDDKSIERVVLIDTAKKASKTVKKLKAAGIETIDAVVISHAHGDHYGAITDVFENFKVKALYLPDTAGLDKYQKTYASAIRSQERKAKKYGASCTYLKAGKGFTVGKIHCDCIYQVPAGDLDEHDDHHFVNNQSIVLRFTLDGIWTYHTAGDLQNPGNNLLIKAVKDLKADMFKCQWHGDANACNPAICKAVMPKVAFSNYHHLERSGRGTTRKRLEAVGAVVARNAENGDIYTDCQGDTMKLSCSKGNLSKTWKKHIAKEEAGEVPDYRVSLTTKVKPTKGSGILAIEPEDYTEKEIRDLKAAGYRVLGYLSVGSVSNEVNYYKSLEKYTLRRLDDWEHERYLDVCQEDVQKWAISQGKKIIGKGCDGLWIDNLDVYEEYPSEAAYKGITSILQGLYSYGYIMINGGIKYVTKAITSGLTITNGITQEEVFSKITDYSGKGKFGRQTSSQSTEYQKYIALAISKRIDAFLLEYTEDESLKKKIRTFCAASGAGYYISSDVDL